MLRNKAQFNMFLTGFCQILQKIWTYLLKHSNSTDTRETLIFKFSLNTFIFGKYGWKLIFLNIGQIIVCFLCFQEILY